MADALSDIMLPMLRTMLGDDGETQVYADDDLKIRLLTAAMLIKIDITFDTDYNVDMQGLVISPDPGSDNPFMSLVCIKAACMTERGEVTALTKNDVQSVSDNDFIIKTGDTGFNKLQALKVNWCVAYDKAKQDYLTGLMATRFGKAVVSPFTYAYGIGRHGGRV